MGGRGQSRERMLMSTSIFRNGSQGGKTLSGQMFSEVPQVTDILARSACEASAWPFR
jgi:hypothetical protein